jgi:hypothetical protein
MSEGWSMRVTPATIGAGQYPVEWYIVAVADQKEAVETLQRAIQRPDAVVEAVQKLPIAFFQSRQLKPGEIAYLYRRGVSRRKVQVQSA